MIRIPPLSFNLKNRKTFEKIIRQNEGKAVLCSLSVNKVWRFFFFGVLVDLWYVWQSLTFVTHLSNVGECGTMLECEICSVSVTRLLSSLAAATAAAVVSPQLSVSQCFTGRRWRGEGEERKRTCTTNQKRKASTMLSGYFYQHQKNVSLILNYISRSNGMNISFGVQSAMVFTVKWSILRSGSDCCSNRFSFFKLFYSKSKFKLVINRRKYEKKLHHMTILNISILHKRFSALSAWQVK